LYFVVFSLVGVYFLLNVVLAVVFNSFMEERRIVASTS
jgi:hypothetical protein